MSTLSDRPNTALMVIDVQNGVVAETLDRDHVIANINILIGKARAEQVKIIWLQHSADDLPKESDEWQFVPELSRDDADPLVPKTFADAFEDTDLEDVLAGAGVGHLVVSGAQTDECIRATIHGAVVRGYDVTLVGDAHTTEDLSEWGAPTPDKVIAHTNIYWENHAAPGRTTAVQATDEVTFTS